MVWIGGTTTYAYSAAGVPDFGPLQQVTDSGGNTYRLRYDLQSRVDSLVVSTNGGTLGGARVIPPKIHGRDRRQMPSAPAVEEAFARQGGTGTGAVAVVPAPAGLRGRARGEAAALPDRGRLVDA
jgi:hypothetical protein